MLRSSADHLLLYIECATPSVVIPEGNDTSVQEFTITTETMLVTVSLALDFEAAKEYTLVFEIVDDLKVPPLTGEATLKVGQFLKVVQLNVNLYVYVFILLCRWSSCVDGLVLSMV